MSKINCSRCVCVCLCLIFDILFMLSHTPKLMHFHVIFVYFRLLNSDRYTHTHTTGMCVYNGDRRG